MKLKKKRHKASPGYPSFRRTSLNRRFFLKSTYASALSLFMSSLVTGCTKSKKQNKSTVARRPSPKNYTASQPDGELDRIMGFGPLPRVRGIYQPIKTAPRQLRYFYGFDSTFHKGKKLFDAKNYREAQKVWQALLDQHYYKMSIEQYNKLVSNLQAVNHKLVFQNGQ